MKSDNKYIKVRILDIPINEEDDPFTVQVCDSGEILELMPDDTYKSDPTSLPSQDTEHELPHLPWTKDKAKVTMILPAFNNAPKQGRLIYDTINDS